MGNVISMTIIVLTRLTAFTGLILFGAEEDIDTIVCKENKFDTIRGIMLRSLPHFETSLDLFFSADTLKNVSDLWYLFSQREFTVESCFNMAKSRETFMPQD